MEAIVNHTIRKTAALAVAVLIGVSACADLDVPNPNAPDAERALATPGDVQTLIQGSYRQWWLGTQHELSGSPIMANQSFMFASWPANFGMFFYSRLPGVPIINRSVDQFYNEMVGYTWDQSYRAISAVAEGLQAINEDPAIAEGLGAEDVLRARAFGKFVLGIAHGSLAILYDEAWIIDETVERTDADGNALPLETRPYPEVLEAALGYLDEAIELSQGAGFTIPSSWTSRSVSAAQLARIASSKKAQFRSSVARTPAEREALPWDLILQDIDNGVTEDWGMMLQHLLNPWWSRMTSQFSDASVGWAQVSYMVDGMADQSGMYQDWLSSPPSDRLPQFEDGSPRLIQTPDQRFPQGDTEEEQRENPGMEHSVTESPHIVVGPLSWGQPARGTYRWSYYRRGVTDFLRASGSTPIEVPTITMAEMRLLRAEAHMYGVGGSEADAAALINVSRVAAGLNPTDAGGTNTDCVPRLPDESCGDLFEMLKWEKRMETAFFGLHAVPWWFDSRGWGDLYLGTALQRPVPCLQREIIQGIDPGAPACITFGGPGGDSSSPGSQYEYPHEL
jgi:starch-binding outer membrane protein, SusD/RagB family